LNSALPSEMMGVKEPRMKSDESERLFRDGFNCAQSVFIPFALERGLSAEAASRTASSFGSGMGRMQETCGAVTGALMAIGLKHGFTKAEDQGQKDVVLERTKEFLAEFRKEFGKLKCRDFLAFDLNTDEGRKLSKEQNQKELICMHCVRFAASLVERSR
jgi:C_GCAxxG_C_C family probable redox protein